MYLLLIIAISLLTGCAKVEAPVHSGHTAKPSARYVHRYKQANDGAPSGPLPSKFQKVNPKYEPYSRYGNPDSYNIEGRQYSVLQSASGYKARGIASWYGTKFHTMRTSSGDRYNMYSMTAAHKTLPLPSYVRVKNLDNGRVAVVRVNDRGPFRQDRIIDLSYAAAAKLGLLPKGTAHVEIESLVPPGTKTAHYYLQAGAFNSAAVAAALKQKLSKITTSPVFIEKQQQQYLVKAGPFAAKKMTETLKKVLAQNGVKGSFALLQ